MGNNASVYPPTSDAQPRDGLKVSSASALQRPIAAGASTAQSARGANPQAAQAGTRFASMWLASERSELKIRTLFSSSERN